MKKLNIILLVTLLILLTYAGITIMAVLTFKPTAEAIVKINTITTKYITVIPIKVKLTNYTTNAKETDNSPTKAASGHNITLNSKILAVSPDILEKYDLKFGDAIYINSDTAPYFNGRWIIEDVSSNRIKNTIEICIANPQVYMRFAIPNQTVLIPIKLENF